MKVKATIDFIDLEHDKLKRKKGTTFEADTERAKYLIGIGFAEKVIEKPKTAAK